MVSMTIWQYSWVFGTLQHSSDDNIADAIKLIRLFSIILFVFFILFIFVVKLKGFRELFF